MGNEFIGLPFLREEVFDPLLERTLIERGKEGFRRVDLFVSSVNFLKPLDERLKLFHFESILP